MLGVVYNPSSDELYLAVTGHGSYLNGRRMAVSKATAVNQAMLVSTTSISSSLCSILLMH